jgi:hypothetical protein
MPSLFKAILPWSRSDWWWAGAIALLSTMYICFLLVMASLSNSIYLQFQAKFKENQLEILSQYVLGSSTLVCDTCSGLAQIARLEGWSGPEKWGIWTTGTQATLAIRLPDQLPDRLELTIRLTPMTDRRNPQEVDVLVNGQKVGHWVFARREEDIRRLVIDRSLAEMLRPMQLSFVIYHPVAPSSFVSSTDDRLLGIGLRELRIEEFRKPGVGE